ncbi:MAG: SDR family NAD(P)-dependent oxidoreductase [Nonomuraea sp.]|nr:SDR family NAD(P)-dependent oxidoreductase [Nonomuraea sp.]
MSKVCLITGASAGIGLATAQELERAGHIVYGAARRVERMSGLQHALKLDVSVPEQLDEAVQTILDEQGRIDVLVNNAGAVLHGAVEDVPLERARQQFEVNVFGPARLIQLVLPGMRERGSGTIVNISSIGGVISLPLGAWYYAAKHALEGMSDTLRMEVQPFGIDVVIVQPGIIRTEFEDPTAEQLREFSGAGAYRQMAENMIKTAGNGLGDGSDPELVATTIREAVEAETPETRYAVGKFADQLLDLNRTMSDREFDELAMKAVK